MLSFFTFLQPRFDDGRFERRINKIEDNLVAYEPHLAQLLQLDAIGAHILTAEHEKQIRWVTFSFAFPVQSLHLYKCHVVE